MKVIKNIICLLMCITIVIPASACTNSSAVTSATPKHRLEWWLSDIGWDEERVSIPKTAIKIAIIDSGIDANHPDIKNSIKENIRISELVECSNNNTDHGTAVAGIICAHPQNEKGLLGIVDNAQIYSIDVTDNSNGSVETSSLINGINIAVEKNVDIINISIGVLNDNQQLHNAIKRAYEAGIVIVSSAGNFMDKSLLYPSAYKEVICVGSKSKDGEIISPKSPESFDEKSIIYLPGEYITSTSSKNTYSSSDGTSLSAPILTGIIALMIQNNPEISQNEIYNYFSKTTKNIKVKNCIDLK